MDFQISVDRVDRAQPDVWMLAVAEGVSTTFSGVVGRLPLWMVEEHTQPREVVRIQMLLLLAERL